LQDERRVTELDQIAWLEGDRDVGGDSHPTDARAVLAAEVDDRHRGADVQSHVQSRHAIVVDDDVRVRTAADGQDLTDHERVRARPRRTEREQSDGIELVGWSRGIARAILHPASLSAPEPGPCARTHGTPAVAPR
jgi:hypothetical protein